MSLDKKIKDLSLCVKHLLRVQSVSGNVKLENVQHLSYKELYILVGIEGIRKENRSVISTQLIVTPRPTISGP